MSTLRFNKQGRLIGLNQQGKLASFTKQSSPRHNPEEDFSFLDEKVYDSLQDSSSLDFLKPNERYEHSKDTEGWSLYEGDKRLEPLIFSNNKSQEDIVLEICSKIKKGAKIIFLHGACGTGKSAIALNIARKIGKTSIVVPVKGLQRQYEEDYSKRKYVLKENGEKLKIAMITGRENHDSLFLPGKSCADPLLPDTIKITQKNIAIIQEYYNQNPLIENKHSFLDVQKVRRTSVAPANPYWSPIRDAQYPLPLFDANKMFYRGLRGKEFIFYHRKPGCSYYDQYLSYLYADVIIFNSAKYKIEVSMDRKPLTEIDIIDEADEFLDSLSTQEDLSLTKLNSSLTALKTDNQEADKVKDAILEQIDLEFQNKKAIGIDDKKIFKLKETNVYKAMRLLASSTALQAEIETDELSYSFRALEISDTFYPLLDDTYAVFSKRDDEIICSLVTTNLSEKLKEIISKGKAFIFMSGTLHSEEVLKSMFGLEDFASVEAETSLNGTLEIQKTGKEFDCSYKNLSSDPEKRKHYLEALETSLKTAKKPVLAHINAFEDLPSESEKFAYNLSTVITKEALREIQNNDKTGKLISDFKNKAIDILFSTRCSRGVDFPGDQCNSIVFTKYPNPNVQGMFWKILKETHKQYYWSFYKDKARREFFQRVYRALRSKDDFVYILSPDERVHQAVINIQNRMSPWQYQLE